MLPPRDLRQEQAVVLPRKATQDERLLDAVLGLPEVDDEPIGFHFQQAAEKLLKAVLAAHGVTYERTHKLADLIRLLPPQEALPVEAAQLDELTDFAVIFRYEDLPPEQIALDRHATRDLLRRLRAWAETQIESAP